MPAESDFLLVIPAHEEQHRLPSFLNDLVEALADAPFTVLVQIVDNGSSATARSQMAQSVAAISGKGSVKLRSILAQSAKGKGSAIQSGWAADSAAPWLAFVDADGAVPAREVRRLLTLAHESRAPESIDSVIAIRARHGGHAVRRHGLRAAASLAFALGIGMLFRARFDDTQCGCKIVSRSAWNKISGACREAGFLFDLELLLRLRQTQAVIREIEIDWMEKSGGHFHLLRDGFGILRQAARLRATLLAENSKNPP